jgi:hypothetical protein
VHRLRAIAAVLFATTGLDRQQSRQLHFVGIEVLAVDLLGAEDQVVEGQLEQRGHGADRPALRCAAGLLTRDGAEQLDGLGNGACELGHGGTASVG